MSGSRDVSCHVLSERYDISCHVLSGSREGHLPGMLTHSNNSKEQIHSMHENFIFKLNLWFCDANNSAIFYGVMTSVSRNRVSFSPITLFL